jgi:hypothetical protein
MAALASEVHLALSSRPEVSLSDINWPLCGGGLDPLPVPAVEGAAPLSLGGWLDWCGGGAVSRSGRGAGRTKWIMSPVVAAELPVDREYAVALEAEPLALTRIPLIVPGRCVKEELERRVEAAAESCVVVDRGRCPSIFFA